MFNVGEKVKCIKDINGSTLQHGLSLGGEYIITSISPCNGYIRFNNEKFGYKVDHFELVKDKKKPDIDYLQLAKDVSGSV